jgi:hypothetical protein
MGKYSPTKRLRPFDLQDSRCNGPTFSVDWPRNVLKNEIKNKKISCDLLLSFGSAKRSNEGKLRRFFKVGEREIRRRFTCHCVRAPTGNCRRDYQRGRRDFTHRHFSPILFLFFFVFFKGGGEMHFSGALWVWPFRDCRFHFGCCWLNFSNDA